MGRWEEDAGMAGDAMAEHDLKLQKIFEWVWTDLAFTAPEDVERKRAAIWTGLQNAYNLGLGEDDD